MFCGKLLVKLYVASLGALLGLFWSTPSHFSRFALVLVGFYEKDIGVEVDMVLVFVGGRPS